MSPPAPSTPADRRRLAEARLHGRAPAVDAPLSATQLQRTLHELQVHQIELEMQNEEMQLARDALEAAAARYTELYDFAPVGYLTLDRAGTITQANLAGAALLGLERARLVGKRIGSFVGPSDLPALDAVLKNVFAGGPRQSCEVVLDRKDQPGVTVRIDTGVSPDAQECRVALADVTAMKSVASQLLAAQAATQALLDTSEQTRRAMLGAMEEQKHAEEKVQQKIRELQQWYEATLGREDRVQELKREVNALAHRLGEAVRYASVETPS